MDVGGPVGVVTGGVADEGRDHPGPGVVETWGVAVSLVVTSLE